MKRQIPFFLLLLLCSSVFAQNTSWQERMREQEARVRDKMQDQHDRVDMAYANQMRRVWLSANLSEGLEPPAPPQPVTPEFFNPAEGDWPTRKEVIIPLPADLTPKAAADEAYEEELLAEELTEKAFQPEASPLMEEQVATLSRTASATFFGKELRFQYDPRMQFRSLPYVQERHIADAWQRLEAANHEALIYQLQREAALLRLNDWGYSLMVNRVARQLYSDDKNARTLFNWFVLSKSGYKATVCYDSDRLYLMMPVQRTLYGQTFLNTGDGMRYYVFDLDGGKPRLSQVRVFNHAYPKASRKLNLNVRRAPSLPMSPIRRSLSFNWQGKTYNFPVVINQRVLDYYASFPTMELDIYMRAPLSDEIRQSLLPPLREAVKGMSEQDAVNFLLRFVQTAFQYKTDPEQFGRERYMFAEETLFFPYSDCEDRAALFARLTREVLGMEVVGLVFPGHAATAVRFSQEPDRGQYIEYAGARYFICDPTYINASFGMLLPEMRGKEAEVLRL